MALDVALKAYGRWSSVFHDIWNVPGILGGIGYGADGQSFITSHYGYYMSSWHLVMGLSGQHANVTEKSLTFTPRLDPPYMPCLAMQYVPLGHERLPGSDSFVQ